MLNLKKEERMGLDKINKPEPLAKTAYKALRQSILNNELTPGVVYYERSLAADLGISRTPVRVALVELASKRLVKFLPQKGVVVNSFSKKDVDNASEIRMALEVFAIKKICRKIQVEELTLLKKHFTDLQNAARLKDGSMFMVADKNFHIGVVRLTKNSYLIDMMEDVRDVMHLMGIKALRVEGRMQDVVKEHQGILDAVEKGDALTAAQQMEHHLENSRKAGNQSLPE